MGIPHLTRLLHPHATSIEFSAAPTRDEHGVVLESASRNCDAVVDGPALAYHAYSRALALRSTARNALEAIPSYREVGDVAVAWLDLLQEHGINVYVYHPQCGPLMTLFQNGDLLRRHVART